mgnify:CR=1 FL=1
MLITIAENLEVDVDKGCFNDMEMLDILVDLDSGDPLAISKLCTRMLSKEDKKKLYDHFRDKDGQVRTEVFIPIVMDIMSKLGEEEKNS